MHYNLNERLKPKKHIPWKKALLIVALILAAIAVYVLAFHDTNKPPETPVKVDQPA